ncbi:MAG TPA: D-aminopeptidase [Caulobacteraceae bacterium]
MGTRLDQVLQALPNAYPGPGGAIAVLREGTVLARGVWGWANAEKRIAFTSKSLFRICSITKQFTCGLVLSAYPDPSVLDGDVRERLPGLRTPAPSALQLCHNQSGLRDYFALAMLHGATPEQAFGEPEAAAVIGGVESLQFAPGTRYSYANQNFRILADIVAHRAGRTYAELLRTQIFDRAGMETAQLAADTRSLPDETEGYEGSQAHGFWPAVNRIVWTGDAGLAASLDDMIAWERHIDAARDDPNALYSRLSPPATFVDGHEAPYAFGLRRGTELGRLITGHGGALRGWRSYRLYAPKERVSVVVMFNHMSDAHRAAIDLFAAVFDETPRSREPVSTPPTWLGAYIEPETGLSARVEPLPDGVRLRFGHPPEEIPVQGNIAEETGEVRLWMAPDGLAMDRPAENLSARLRPCEPAGGEDISGHYECRELDARLTVAGREGLFYGAFSGFLGDGRMELLSPIGRDVWALPCPRALDHTPPGDWTLGFHRDARGVATEATVGCWLARGMSYARKED